MSGATIIYDSRDNSMFVQCRVEPSNYILTFGFNIVMSDDLLVPDPGIAHGRCVDVGPVGEGHGIGAPGPEENTFLDPSPYGPGLSPAGDFATLRKIAAARRGVIRTIRNDRLESLESM
ncbi:hypothetical protein C362_05135 [Cryptococcus neoformans Bt1]|nr:hypothetical protein C362_05135 [Cryptococcus neoformans var. grubii Bt1]